MIIGNDSNKKGFNINTNFQKRINQGNELLQQESQMNSKHKTSNPQKNVFTKDIFKIEGGDTSNQEQMYTKSIAMLNDRLEKGLITMDEFTKKCNDIAKKRNNL